MSALSVSIESRHSAYPAESAPAARGLTLLFAALIFASVASIKDLLPNRPAAGSLHPQDLLKAGIFLAGGLAALHSSRRLSAALTNWPQVLASLFLGWCFLTVPISLNPKTATLGAGLLCLLTLFVPYALERLGPVHVLRTLVATLLVFLFVSTAVFLVFPSHNLFDPSEARRLAGLCHSNSMGQMAGFMLIASLALHAEGQLSNRALVAIGCVALVVFAWAQSRTPALAAIAATAFFFWRRGMVTAQAAKRMTLLICLGGLLLGMALMVAGLQPPRPWDRSKSMLSRSGSTDEFATLTGRDVIWQFALNRIQQRPITGFGYGSAPLVFYEAAEKKELYFNYGSAHNLVLEVALNMGWMGAGIVVASLLSLLGMAWSRPCLFPDMVFVFVAITGITEAVLFGPVPGPATMLWLLALNWRSFSAAPRDAEDCLPWRSLPLALPRRTAP